MKPVIIVHHHEIILKGGNRGFFERQLMRNIRASLGAVQANAMIRGGYGRFIIDIVDESRVEEIVSCLKSVFGIANICTGVEVAQDVNAFTTAAVQMLEQRQFKTLKVETRRADKNFPKKSMEVSAEVGGVLCDRFAVRANMTTPDEIVYISIVDSTAFVYLSKVQGSAGLPAGVSGRVVGLLSAGIDSPVACWQLMKRGANVIFVHFHSMPYTSQNAVDQVRQLTALLTKFQFQSKLYLVPFAEVQQKIVQKAPQPLRIILYRRLMVRIAEEVAWKEKAEALVTGEAVGQVASQTLRNIRAIDAVATLPILRPLAGMDKEETITYARRIGTFEISKEPFDDCCSFLAPRSPETWARLEEVDQAESHFDIPSLVSEAMQNVVIEKFTSPTVERESLATSSVL